MARATPKKSNTRRSRAAGATTPRKSAAQKATPPPLKVTPIVASDAKRPFPNSWQLVTRTWRFWRQHWRVLAVYVLVLAGLNLLLVHNFGTDITTLKTQAQQAVGGNVPARSLTTYALLVGSSGSSAQGTAAVYQYVLIVLASLSSIWLLRQLLSDTPPVRLRVRDAFYQGMYPLVPFILVLLMLTLELLPLLIGTFVYTVIVQNGIAVGAVQDIMWLLVLLLGATVSLWLIVSSIFGIYIATLPNMTPVLALRNARQLARGQRVNIIRKLLFLLTLFLIVGALVLVPIIAIVPVLAGATLFILGVLALPATHSYLYMMYRELLA